MKAMISIIVTIMVGALAIYFYKATLIILATVIFLFMHASIQEIKRARRLKKFRVKHNGKYYLWYSSNKRLKNAIEEKLKPLINLDFEIIFNNKGIIESKLKHEELRYLRNESYHLKFPLLYKIEKEKIRAVSLYNEVYEFKEQRIIKEIFEKKVNEQIKKLNNGE